jgi:hypothetical protein
MGCNNLDASAVQSKTNPSGGALPAALSVSFFNFLIVERERVMGFIEAAEEGLLTFSLFSQFPPV